MRMGYLYFNEDTDRFGIINSSDLWENEGLHCGEVLEVLINDEWIQDRIEMTWDEEYYLVNSKLKGNELNFVKVNIKE
ncbi:DUF5348 domain-containing protein [uncultured Clostridium sp.]|uniref:DUF5348 domain-containing protein n=1 Tax=uncultured Clostridium sp. TaxID=59620 RepID=UPI0025E64F97|nr:DUF5348 domain-containing protein [uncultured Clostridium sp.]